MHGTEQVSPWIRRWTPLCPAGQRVLDLACGAGRHTRWFAQHGYPVTAVDRNADAVAPLRELAEVVVADLEQGAWPLPGHMFGAVVVTHYLWRPLWPHLLDAVAEGGALLYETFAAGNETVGRPSNPDFLLQPGELLETVRGRLRVIAYEDGYLDDPPRYVQRIAAVRDVPGAGPVAHRL